MLSVENGDERRLERIYNERFGRSEEADKENIWKEVGRFLQRYVKPGDKVLDVGCDRGYFIRNIQAQERWASDLRDMRACLPPEVRFVASDGLKLDEVLQADYFDVVFMSNYLEHLATPLAVIAQLQVAAKLVRPGGHVLILQPNLRLVGWKHWDFIDHQTPLTEKSLEEAAQIAGLETEQLIVRFLPYTTKSWLPRAGGLVRLYLACPWAWRVMGQQSLYWGCRRA